LTAMSSTHAHTHMLFAACQCTACCTTLCRAHMLFACLRHDLVQYSTKLVEDVGDVCSRHAFPPHHLVDRVRATEVRQQLEESTKQVTVGRRGQPHHAVVPVVACVHACESSGCEKICLSRSAAMWLCVWMRVYASMCVCVWRRRPRRRCRWWRRRDWGSKLRTLLV
jgi:hypothetical protein